MLVSEVMTRRLITLRPDDSIRRAIQVLYSGDITAAPVVDENGRLEGIVSEIDLLRGEYQATAPPRTVGDVMTTDLWAVRETADTTVVIELMLRNRVKSVPVVREGVVVGIVSRRDLLARLARTGEAA